LRTRWLSGVARRLSEIEPSRLLFEMIGKRTHGRGPGAGSRLGCEPAARSCLVAQAQNSIRVMRKNFSWSWDVQALAPSS